MKSAIRRVMIAIPVAILLAWGPRYSLVAMAPQHTSVTVTNLYTGDDKESHSRQFEMKFVPVAGASGLATQSQAVNVTTAYVVRLAPGFYESWHNADKRRYVIVMSGRAEVEVAGGQKIILSPGQLVLAEDLTGKGHTFRVLGTEDWVALFVDFAQ